jgi:hypothetical protein
MPSATTAEVLTALAAEWGQQREGKESSFKFGIGKEKRRNDVPLDNWKLFQRPKKNLTI